jgi:hypothetical protein
MSQNLSLMEDSEVLGGLEACHCQRNESLKISSA